MITPSSRDSQSAIGSKRRPSSETCDEFRNEVNEVICAYTPDPFYAVGLWYEDFSQTSDEEVRELLGRAAASRRGAPQR
jgi:predicted phosphoribosyltransferase